MPMPGGGRRRRINGLDFVCFCFLSEYQTVVIRLLRRRSIKCNSVCVPLQENYK